MNFDEWFNNKYPPRYRSGDWSNTRISLQGAWNAAWKERGEVDAQIAENITGELRTEVVGKRIAKAIREVDDEL